MTLLVRPTQSRYLRMLKFIFRPVDYLDEYGKRYGDLFAVGSEDYPFVYVSNPKAIQEIFAFAQDVYESGRGNGVLRFLLGDASLVLLDGETHQRQRKLLMPPFHGERLRTYSQTICDITEEVTRQWQVGKSFRVRSFMQDITLKVILQAVFGLQSGQRYNQLRQLLTALLEAISSPLASTMLFFPILRQEWNWTPWGRFLRLKQQVDQLLLDEIHERRKKGNLDGEDILTLLILARDENNQPMTDNELRDELMTLLVAGHETTASALSWALYWIHYLPDVQTKVRSELASLGDHPTPTEIAKLPYLNAACLETLRIYPIAMTAFPRLLKTSVDLMGHHFTPGTVLSPCIYLVHHREDIYPEPKQFKPERFLERQFSPYEYFPFGGGTRRCIGMALAMLEMKLAIASILSHFQLALTRPIALKPVRRGLTVAPPAHFKMKVISLVG